MVISGCIGPRGDGYVPDRTMSSQKAQNYHAEQIETFARTAADMVCAMTLNYVEEAIGIVEAARQAGVPVCISFTVETGGRLPTGQTLESAIERVDEATLAYPGYYMVNCVHPTHLATVLATERPWMDRIGISTRMKDVDTASTRPPSFAMVAAFMDFAPAPRGSRMTGTRVSFWRFRGWSPRVLSVWHAPPTESCY